MTRRRAVALLASGATCLLSAGLPIVTAHADNAPGSGLGSFGMSASAPGVQLKFGEPTYCFTTPAGLNGCEGVVPEATSQLQNGPIGGATAAIAWPGSLAANAGSLLITANGSVPSQASMLNDPVRAEVKTGSTPDTVTYNSVPGSSMKAVAKETITSADAWIDNLSIAAVGTIGSVAGHTTTSLTGPKQATSKATSQVSDVLLAGVVRIGSVSATATAVTDGITAKVKGSTTVSNATVAGIPVTIDETGVHAMGNGTALDPATSQVSNALSAAGITLLVTKPQGTPVGAGVAYTSGSLVAVFSQMGYSVAVNLGGANVSVSASPGFASDLPASPTSPQNNPGVPPVSNPGTIVPGSPGTPGTAGTPPLSGAVQPPTTDPGTTVPAPTTVDPVLAAEHAKLGRGALSPWLVALGLLGTGLVLAGLRRLPDRILESTAPVCPLEETA
jgi:hypothetical protein